MKKKIGFLLLLGLVGALTAVGCGKEELAPSHTKADQSKVSENNRETGGAESEKAADLLDSADLYGTVTSFSESGCTIVEGKINEDEQIVAADGAETNTMREIPVIYNNDTRFEIANSSYTEINIKEASIEDVKKQSAVYIFGSYQDDGSFLTNRVIITRFVN